MHLISKDLSRFVSNPGGEAMADPQWGRLVRSVLERQNNAFLKHVCTEAGPYGGKSNAKKAEIIDSILEWAQSDAGRHANVCQALLSIPAVIPIGCHSIVCNFLMSFHCGRGHAGKSKKEAIQNFIAADSRHTAADSNRLCNSLYLSISLSSLWCSISLSLAPLQ